MHIFKWNSRDQLHLLLPLHDFDVNLIEHYFVYDLINSGYFQYHLDLQHRYITPFFNSVINTTFKPCEFLNGNSNNLVAKFILDVFSKTMPAGFAHKCPYDGVFTGKNVTFNRVSQGPSFLGGRYRSISRVSDRHDDNIFKANLEFDLK